MYQTTSSTIIGKQHLVNGATWCNRGNSSVVGATKLWPGQCLGGAPPHVVGSASVGQRSLDLEQVKRNKERRGMPCQTCPNGAGG